MKKNSQKSIAFFLMISILILCFAPVSSKNVALSSDRIDQEQTQSSGKDYVYNDHWKAQSFKPTTKTLTRIQLYINKIGSITSDFEVIIRDALTGQNLTNYSISSSQIPLTNPDWIDIDFADMQVIVGQTYYIICKTTTGDESNSYNWYEAVENPYEQGTKYYSDSNGATWQQSPDYDFCFKTFGQKAELDIPYIRGGIGWNIYYGIENTGTTQIDEIDVNIAFSGGLVLTGKTRTDTINQQINPGEIIDNTMSPVIGFGPTRITITVASPEASSVSKTVDAFMFLFSIYISPS